MKLIMKEGRIKLIINIITFCIITVGIGYIFLNKYMESRINNQIKTISEIKNIKIQEEIKEYPKIPIINEYKGYDVCAKLEIPIIELETYVLQNYSVQALNISVTKFWGVNPNQIGNFCVAGHNFINKNMFKNLKKLNIGDKIILTDNEIGQVEYEVFDIYKVIPEDTSCLYPTTEGKREITLITCTSDSEKRIIVKAKEVE